MNYRHIYHAGSFTDIVKHLCLISVLNNYLLKDKPFAVLDCFAGIGVYDLTSDEVMRGGEAGSGIKLLEMVKGSVPDLVSELLGISRNKDLYFGSPMIIARKLRITDKLFASELHKDDFESLRQNIYPYRYCHALNIDGYNALKANLPFKENRGIIFLDPAFEVKDEFEKLIEALSLIKARAQNYTTIVWYPIKSSALVKKFNLGLKKLSFKEILNIEFNLKNAPTGLDTCGILIINPPNVRSIIDESLKFLVEKVYNPYASYNITI